MGTSPSSLQETDFFSTPCSALKIDNDPNKIVCLCDEQYCDELSFDWPQESGHASLIQSSSAGMRFQITELPLSGTNASRRALKQAQSRIRVDLGSEHQSILGWGGAFTDAAGYNLRSLPKPLASKLLESLYGETGLQYVSRYGKDLSPHVL